MNERELVEYVAAIVTTIAETKGESVQSGHLYAALMGRIGHSDYTRIVAIMLNVGLVESAGNCCLRLTAKGRETAAKLNAALAA